ncbi:MAG: hypothetical protein P8Z79_12220 [Sedimentisphaerales bacterium]|jgi:DNA-directed RNA polymerase subunit RPC12/RpoP
MIRFCCEHCGRIINVRDKYAGKRGKCPECGAAFVVPARAAAIGLQCENCGQKINVPKTYPGTQVKCPSCNFIITLPARPIDSGEEPARVRFTCSVCNREIKEPESSRGKLVSCPHCRSFVAVPPPPPAEEAVIPIQPEKKEGASEETFEELQTGSIKEFKREPDHATERKLPWIFDIFLYPMSTSGIAVLAIVVVTRFLCRVIVRYLADASQAFMPCMAFFGLAVPVAIIVRIVLYMYFCWYLCECVRSSAAGGVRAVETKGYTAGLGETFGQTIKVGGCVLLYLGPALCYLGETKETNWIFWCLAVYGIFFFPMSFLAVAMVESWWGLNPIFVIGSVFSTVLPYLAMVLTTIVAVVVIVTQTPDLSKSYLTFFLAWLVGVYLAMIVAHVLGAFYHRYEEKLNWDV